MTTMVFSIPGMPCLAHHSVAGTYNTSSLVTVRGEIIQVFYGNPHAWFDLRVKSETSEVLTQRVEIAAPGRLLRTGFDRSLLNVGNDIAVDVWASKNIRNSDRLSGRTVILAGGRRFDVADNWR
jgi:hypothetical protein